MEPSDYLNPAQEKMELAVAYLDEALAHIRAGKANPKILDSVRVSYYGSNVLESHYECSKFQRAETVVGRWVEKP